MQIPSTAELTATIVSQLEAALSQTVPLASKAFLRVLGKVEAGEKILHYKYGSWILLQLFAEHAATQEVTVFGRTFIPLERLGERSGVGKRKVSERAELVVEITVKTQTGSLPNGSSLVRTDTGVIYQTSGDVLLNAAIKEVTIVAVFDPAGNRGAGTIGNLEVGDKVEFSNALANVGREATVVSIARTGADAEPWEQYRARVQRRERSKPQGGAYSDYRIWAEEVEGILNAYAYTSDTPGEVDVYCESSTQVDGIPTGDQLTAVAVAIEVSPTGEGRRPANAAVNVLPITRTEFTCEVTNLLGDNVAALQTDATAALEEHFLDREPRFVLGSSILPRRDRISQLELAGIVSTIASASGGTVGAVTLKEGASVLSSRVMGPGEKAKVTVVYDA